MQGFRTAMNDSSEKTAIDLLTERNRAFAAHHDGGEIPAAPAMRVAVVTCMDCRIDVYRLLGLEPGEAHVIRNAGGRARDALRSLIVSQRKLGTREIMLITHTGCGMASFSDAEFQSELGPDAEGIDFDTFESPEQAAAEDAAYLSQHPLIVPGTLVCGFVYDVRSGALSPAK
jgi:carbonic anhydrase